MKPLTGLEPFAGRMTKWGWRLPLALALGLALFAAGCGKKETPNPSASTSSKSAEAPTPSTNPPTAAPQTPMPSNAGPVVVPGADSDLSVIQQLNRAAIGFRMQNRRFPSTVEELAAFANIQLPTPPPGKKYAFDKRGFVVLVDKSN